MEIGVNLVLNASYRYCTCRPFSKTNLDGDKNFFLVQNKGHNEPGANSPQ